MTRIKYLPVDDKTVHIRIYCDGSYQSLAKTNSKIGFLFELVVEKDRMNIIHGHSSCAPWRPSSTEQSELLAMDKALFCYDRHSTTIRDLIKRDIPFVLYTDYKTLSNNMMNKTVPTIPKMRYRVRKFISRELVHSISLIASQLNPADDLIKQKPNHFLVKLIVDNQCITPAKRVFMLQESNYRNCTFIPTSSAPMLEVYTNDENK